MRILSNANPSWQGQSIVATLEIDNIEASSTLSVDEFNTTNLFSIVPTVIDDKLNLSLSNAVVAENSKLMIFDSSGKRSV